MQGTVQSVLRRWCNSEVPSEKMTFIVKVNVTVGSEWSWQNTGKLVLIWKWVSAAAALHYVNTSAIKHTSKLFTLKSQRSATAEEMRNINMGWSCSLTRLCNASHTHWPQWNTHVRKEQLRIRASGLGTWSIQLLGKEVYGRERLNSSLWPSFHLRKCND